MHSTIRLLIHLLRQKNIRIFTHHTHLCQQASENHKTTNPFPIKSVTKTNTKKNQLYNASTNPKIPTRLP